MTAAQHARRALAVASVTQMVVIVDSAVLGIALPRLASDLDVGAGALPWVTNAYALPLAGLLMLGGRVADLISPASCLRLGLLVFTVGSLGAGLAPTLPVLLGCRVLQGVGGALLSPAGLALLTVATPAGVERERAIGVWSVTAAAGGTLAALVGGIVTQTLGWRWVLLVNVAITPLLFVATFGLSTPQLRRARVRTSALDVPGTVLLLCAIASIDLAGTAGNGGVRPVRAAAWCAAAVVATVALLLAEARASHPLLPLADLRRPQVAFPNGAAFLLLAGSGIVGFYATLYAQDVDGLTPFETALCLLPVAVTGMSTSRAVPRLLALLGERTLRTTGPLLAAVGISGLAPGMHARVPFVALVPLLMVSAVGSSISVVTLTSAATRSMPPERSGIAGGLISMSGQTGATVGLALLTGLAASLTASAGASSPAARAAATTDQVLVAFPLSATLLVGAALLCRRIPSSAEHLVSR